MASTSSCPSLPAELWGSVFSNIHDSFDLWTTCRQISNGLKIEAERAFCVRFLPDMRIGWSIGKYNRDGEFINIVVRAEPDKTLLDAASSFAVFPIHVQGFTCNGNDGHVGMSHVVRKNLVLQALSYRGLNIYDREPLMGATTQTKVMFFETSDILAFYVNDPEIPGLEIHLKPFQQLGSAEEWSESGHILFDWKELMTSFFAEELWVRRHSMTTFMKENNPPSLTELLVDFKSSLEKECPSLVPTLEPELDIPRPLAIKNREHVAFKSIGERWKDEVSCAYTTFDEALYIEAYKKRILKAQMWKSDDEGLDLNHLPTFDEHAQEHACAFYEARSGKARDLIQRYWYEEIGIVVQILPEDDEEEHLGNDDRVLVQLDREDERRLGQMNREDETRLEKMCWLQARTAMEFHLGEREYRGKARDGNVCAAQQSREMSLV